MLTSPGLPTISESEVLWAKDVEDAFIEALKLYSINGPKWVYKDGKKFGRNKLISEDIKKKCGKILTEKQISSHIQVYKQRNKVKEANKSLTTIKRPLIMNYLIAPQIYYNELLGLSNFGPTQFLQTQENSYMPYYFTHLDNLLENMLEVLSIRKISSDKLALCANLVYAHEKINDRNTIIRGFTCISESNLSDIHINQVFHHFGYTLLELYSKVPQNSFYFVKSYMNLDYLLNEEHNPVDIKTSQIFYSSNLMDVEMESTIYILGHPVYTFIMANLAVYEATIDQLKYFIYKPDMGYKTPVRSLIKQMSKLKEIGDTNLIQFVARNHARLVILREKYTREVLLVLACVYDYLPGFAGYQLFKIIP